LEWIAAVVAAVLAVLGALFLKARGKDQSAGGSGAPPLGPGTPAPGESIPLPDAPALDKPSPAPDAPSSDKPSPSAQTPPSGPVAEPTPGEGLPAAALAPVAEFDPAALSGNLLRKAVEAGQFEAPVWVEVEWDGLVLSVGAHALRAKVGDALLRLPVSWKDTLAICKTLGWCPPTSAISDAIWKAATMRVTPVPLGNFSTPEKASETSKKMVRLGFCKTHNQNVDAAIPPDRTAELCATEGKDWILSKRNLTTPKAATTYGWHQPSGKPIQPLGPDEKPPAHDDGHFDQTQVLRPIQRKARRKSDGALVDLLDELEHRGLPPKLTKPLRG
jgi:hypothetical protein